MTLDEFIDKLAAFTKEQKLKWEINNRGQLRCGPCCPITCFSGRDADKVIEEADRIGINHQVYFEEIVWAADGRPSLTRQRLLQACGLTEGQS